MMAGGRFFATLAPFVRADRAQVFPVVQVLALIVFVIPWFIYCFFLASLRDGDRERSAADGLR